MSPALVIGYIQQLYDTQTPFVKCCGINAYWYKRVVPYQNPLAFSNEKLLNVQYRSGVHNSVKLKLAGCALISIYVSLDIQALFVSFVCLVHIRSSAKQTAASALVKIQSVGVTQIQYSGTCLKHGNDQYAASSVRRQQKKPSLLKFRFVYIN